MPNKVRVRSTVSRWPEVLLPLAAGQKYEPPKGGALPSLGVSKTALLSSKFLWEDRCTSWVCHARGLPTVRRSAQQAHRAERTVHRAVAVGVFDSRVLQPFPRLVLVCGHCS